MANNARYQHRRCRETEWVRTSRSLTEVQCQHRRYGNHFGEEERTVDQENLLRTVVQGVDPKLHSDLHDIEQDCRGDPNNVVI